MSLWVYIEAVRKTTVFSRNITHNLGWMAKELGVYEHIWRPEEIGIKKAEELIEPLQEALDRLLEEPTRFAEFNAPNGWGTYEDLVLFIMEYLEACRNNPDGELYASR